METIAEFEILHGSREKELLDLLRFLTKKPQSWLQKNLFKDKHVNH